MDERTALHVEELSRALGNEYKEEIRAELEKLLSFKVPLEEAKRTVINKFMLRSPSAIHVRDLVAGMSGFEIIGRIINIEEKKVVVKDEHRTIFSGSFGDTTGICSFTCWDDMSLKAGNIVRIKNAYVRMWNNRTELYFGKRSVVEKLPDDYMEEIDMSSLSGPKKLRDVSSVDVLASSFVVIIEMYHRDVSLKGRVQTIIEGVLADETGKLPFTSWIPLKGIDIGSFIRFENAAVRVFRGVPSINFNEGTTIELVEQPYDVPFTLETASKVPEPLSVARVLENNGLFDIIVIGDILSVRPGSGMIERCPVCNRVTQKSNCRAHGQVDCVTDMRMKLILDDGTGSVHVMLNSGLSEAIYGKSMYEAEKMVLDSISRDVVFEDMRHKLTGKYIAVRGNSSRNEFGATLVAKSAWYPDYDLKQKVGSLIEGIDEKVINDG
ncbi:Single-stranded DNA binding protein [Methanolobus halotolerans]|uniref:Replication protein A n=1 Tax=Methanolobus halotolerans TaxID=2052935 RepID=A0A4E0Q6C1_9EURY|nr:Single-stranded DNA binding protein [Methanolobus halotolerans]TGC09653.1 replication protein A [Methanolobus halotolerans]